MRRELRLWAREPGTWGLAALYALLLIYGALQGVNGYRDTVAQIVQTKAEYAERWRTIARQAASGKETTWGSWRSASLAGSEQGGAVAWLEPLPTSVLNLGHAVRENPVRRISLYDSPVAPPLANPMNAVYGTLDLGFVVLWILPLMACLTAHQAVGRDWEAGVWPLILVSGISLYRLVLTRLVLPWGLLWLLTMTAAAGSIAMTSGEFKAAWWIWALAVAGYAAVWTGLGACFGLRLGGPSRQLLMAGACWLMAVWVAPGVMDAVTEWLVPRVSAADGLLAAREAQISLAQRGASIARRVYHEHPEWQPSPELVAKMNRPVPGGPRKRDARNVYANYLAAEEAAAPSRERRAERRRRVEELAKRFSWISPVMAMQYFTEEVAGNSFDQYRDFGDRAEGFLREWRGYFAGKVWRLEEMAAEDIEKRPRFQPEAGREGMDGSRILEPLAGVGVWLLGSWVALWVRIRRFSLV